MNHVHNLTRGNIWQFANDPQVIQMMLFLGGYGCEDTSNEDCLPDIPFRETVIHDNHDLAIAGHPGTPALRYSQKKNTSP
jgi:hypothetical protein